MQRKRRRFAGFRPEPRTAAWVQQSFAVRPAVAGRRLVAQRQAGRDFASKTEAIGVDAGSGGQSCCAGTSALSTWLKSARSCSSRLPSGSRIRVHDLRGTFVTVSLANDNTESSISDRTGHRSSAMINNYKRIARGFQELDVGTLSPLDSALPELRALASAASSDQPPPVGSGPEVGQRSQIQQRNEASPRGFEPLLQP